MIKRIIKETTEEYENGKLVARTITETKEDDDNTYYPYYPYSPAPAATQNTKKIFDNPITCLLTTTL